MLKKCGPQIRLCLFMFRPITLKQLNSLTWYVQLTLWPRGYSPDCGARGPAFNTRIWQGLFMLAFSFCCCCVYISCPKTLLICFCNPVFAMLSYSLHLFENIVFDNTWRVKQRIPIEIVSTSKTMTTVRIFILFLTTK